MTEDVSTEPEQRDATPPVKGDGVRRRTIVFVAGFIVLVFSLLVGYRYALDSMFNTWYLFRVAQDTARLLDVLGESCTLESQGFQLGHEEWIRLETRRLRGEGVEDEQLAQTEFAGEPLTAWEIWQYRSLRLMENEADMQNMGPLVHFKASADERFTFRVVPDCGAIPSISIFVAAVLAFPVRFWRRLAGVLLGVPILYLVNVVRLTTLAFIGAWYGGGEVFRFSHEVVWQGIFIIFVVGVWLLWVEFFIRRSA